MMKSFAILCLLLGTARSEPRIELGGALGGHAFAKNSELGADDDSAMPGPASGVAFGARGALLVLPRLALEAEALAIPTTDRTLAFGIRAHVRFDILRGRLVPFVLGGAGMHILAASAQMKSDADQSFHWGLGARYALTSTVDFRLDARHLIVPSRAYNGATSELEVTAGVMVHFGGAAPARALPAPPPAETAPDRDLDTIPDSADKCPLQPEDVDGWQDEDGCPELDNDGDGVRDADDTCVNDKETKNGFRDEDGCPDEVIAELAGIQFASDSARIEAASEPLVDRAYKLLTENPGLSVEISGHTSAEGNADRNMDLSIERAEAVKAALVKRGIAAARLLTVGHGADGKQRIEFRILTPDQLTL